MSKKKNKKFKKTHSTDKVAAASLSEPTLPAEEVESDTEIEMPAEKNISVPPATADPLTEVAPKYNYVKRDVFKLLALILIMLILAGGIYVMNQQYGFLSAVGDWIYKIANFQI